MSRPKYGEFFGKLERIDSGILERMSRKNFLKQTSKFLGAGLIGGKVLFDTGKQLYDKYLEDRIYNELKYYVYPIKVTGEARVGKFSQEIGKVGGGIVLKDKYITMAHIVDLNNLFQNKVDIADELATVHGQKVERLFFDPKKDMAIYNLPWTLKENLRNFPCKVSNKFSLGEEIYVVGNPDLKGFNIRKGTISDLDGFLNIETMLNVRDKNDFFGIDIPLIPGDSGCPIVNKNFELLGLGFCFFPIEGGHLGYVKKIGAYVEEIKILEQNKKKKFGCK